MEFLDLTVEQLASGYIETEFTYECIYCDFKTFKTEIYNYNDKFYTALGMMQLHILIEHESSLNMLLNLSKKENGLSEHQVDLINMINKGYSDKQIANELKLKESTIRYQRFTLREKEKQSKIYLAIMKSLKQKNNGSAHMYDNHTYRNTSQCKCREFRWKKCTDDGDRK